MEQTLVILKPDCMEQRICGKVIARFEEEGYKIIGCQMIQLHPDILREHYAHIADQPFYPAVEEVMQSTPVIAMVFEGEGIIEKMREMIGVTDCLKAAPGTIRASFGSKEEGKNMMLNVVHASDSTETAEKEIARFFNAGELFEY